MTLPLLYDQEGRKLVDYTPPQSMGGHTAIFDWKKDLDIEIWKALEVPPEIIQASSTGSGYSGRWIPFIMALSGANGICRTHSLRRSRCLAADCRLNFGEVPQYEIRPRSLTETYGERFGNATAPPA